MVAASVHFDFHPFSVCGRRILFRLRIPESDSCVPCILHFVLHATVWILFVDVECEMRKGIEKNGAFGAAPHTRRDRNEDGWLGADEKGLEVAAQNKWPRAICQCTRRVAMFHSGERGLVSPMSWKISNVRTHAVRLRNINRIRV